MYSTKRDLRRRPLLMHACMTHNRRLMHNNSNGNGKDSLVQSSMKKVLFKGGVFALDPLLIEDFNPVQSVATCAIVCNRKILLLKRNGVTAHASNTWCMPGGKLEQNETALQAVIREAQEETGIQLLPKEINLMHTIYVRIFTPKQDYLLHLFKTVLPSSQPYDYKVVLNKEHTDYLWVDLEEAKQLNLLPGGKEIFESNLLAYQPN
ncbi:MAG: NUDIX hydrolase [Candidatus Cardinium sp.]|nr:NUDIX hydrolase [Candidatus Cardinium sp.]